MAENKLSWAEFLKQTLSASAYENLRVSLNVSAHRATKIKRQALEVDWRNAQIMATILKRHDESIDMKWLTENYLTHLLVTEKP